MVFTIIIAFISLMGLIILHELGHFLLAKRFGVKIEEFGIGYPPRIYGKKFGETLYSINLLPFGAFVKMPGEIEHSDDPNSFFKKPIWQRSLIVFGGALSFWIVSVILLSIVFSFGTPIAISDEENGNLINPKVQIAAVAPNSPAEKAGIRPGDSITELKIKNKNLISDKNLDSRSAQNEKLKIDKVKQVQEFTDVHKGEEIILTVERGKDIFNVSLVPRVSPPAGEGAMGIGLVRTAIKSYTWYLAPWQGIKTTFTLTVEVIKGWDQALGNVITRQPSGVQMMGPVGIFHLFTQASQLGINYFLQFIALISIYIALFNILPIPAADGGKLLFLGIEAIKRRPINQKIEQNVTSVFFLALVALAIWITIKDIIRIF